MVWWNPYDEIKIEESDFGGVLPSIPSGGSHNWDDLKSKGRFWVPSNAVAKVSQGRQGLL